MKQISKKIIAIAIIMLMILMGVKTVNAAGSSVKMSLSSNSKLVAGQNITVNVNYTQSVAGGIGSIMGTLNFDSNVLEYVSATAQGDWQAAVYTNSTKILGIERNNNTETTGTIATITFKVKEGVTAENTTITYNVTDVGLTDEVSLSPSVTIDANKDASGSEDEGKTNTPATDNKQPGTTNGNKNGSTKNATKNITTSKSTSSKLPKAGDETTIAIISVIAIIAIVGIVGFVKYSKQKDIK